MELKAVNKHIEDVTIEQIEDHKIISQEELNKDLANLFGYDASENTAGTMPATNWQVRCQRLHGR